MQILVTICSTNMDWPDLDERIEKAKWDLPKYLFDQFLYSCEISFGLIKNSTISTNKIRIHLEEKEQTFDHSELVRIFTRVFGNILTAENIFLIYNLPEPVYKSTQPAMA